MDEQIYIIPEGRMTCLFRWWNPLGDLAAKRLLRIMNSWVRTPHQEGQRARRIGVDCVQLCPAVVDEMFKSPLPSFVPRLQADVAMHDIKRGWRTVKAIRTMNKGSILATDGTIEPGDFIVTKGELNTSAPNRAAHVIIAGVDPWTGLHAIPIVGTCWTPVQPVDLPIIQIIRPLGKELWQ